MLSTFARRFGRALALALALSLPAGACYTYQESLSVPEPGVDIRARLTNEAAIQRSQGLDEPVTELEGHLLETSPNGIRMVVIRDQLRDQFRRNVTFWDTLQVSTSEIAFVEVKTLSVARTGLLGAAIAAAVALVVTQAISGGGGDGGDDPGKPSAQMIPLFRLAPRR